MKILPHGHKPLGSTFFFFLFFFLQYAAELSSAENFCALHCTHCLYQALGLIVHVS